jgi:hypothetical protein
MRGFLDQLRTMKFSKSLLVVRFMKVFLAGALRRLVSNCRPLGGSSCIYLYGLAIALLGLLTLKRKAL